ncbi:MAG: T9SS type A sorting domain-containing protein [Bacteroidales bacterium]|nr:T9SS type A sorting domain-containing protein [Bacteroidales bacterium]
MKNILLFAVVFSFLLLNFANAQTIHFQEDFNAGLPATWTVTSSGNATQTWDSTSSYYSFDFDGTKFMLVYDWSGLATNEILTGPSFNAATTNPLYLCYDFRFLYQSTALEGYVDVFDGSSWQNVRVFSGTDTTGIDTIDISTHNNAAMQVRFRFVNATGNGWEHDFMIDNVKVCEFPATSITENDSDSHLPYPNPSVDLLTLKDINNDDIINFIGIYSVKGDLIKTCEKDINVDISDLTPGSYVLRVIVNGVFADDMLFIKQ